MNKFFWVMVLIWMSIPMNGVVVMKMWEWFLVPLGLAPIGIMQGAGIDLLFTFLIPFYSPNDKDIDWGKAATKAILKPIMFLTFGWVVHVCMTLTVVSR